MGAGGGRGNIFFALKIQTPQEDKSDAGGRIASVYKLYPVTVRRVRGGRIVEEGGWGAFFLLLAPLLFNH